MTVHRAGEIFLKPFVSFCLYPHLLIKHCFFLFFLLLFHCTFCSLAVADPNIIKKKTDYVAVNPDPVIDMGSIEYLVDPIIDMGIIDYSQDPVINMGNLEYSPDPLIDMGTINWSHDHIIDMGTLDYSPDPIIDMGLINYSPPSSSLVEQIDLVEVSQQMDQMVLLAPMGRILFNKNRPVVFKFRHDNRKTDFQYKIEMWNNRTKRWSKTTKPKLFRSRYLAGKEITTTMPEFKFTEPGKYRWTLNGYSSLKPLEFELVARKSPLKKTGIQKIKQKPSLWFVQSSGQKMSPKLNQPFGLSFSIKNIGNIRNSSSHKVACKIDCKPLDGGKCVVLVSTKSLPPVSPGSKKKISLKKVLKVTRAGKFKVTLSLFPKPTAISGKTGGLKKTLSFTFAVQRVKKTLRPTASGPSATGLPGSSSQPAGASGSSGSSSGSPSPFRRMHQVE